MAGLTRIWWDAGGAEHFVPDGVLIAILRAMGYPADTSQAIETSLAALEQEQAERPSFLSVDLGCELQLPATLAGFAYADLRLEFGGTRRLSITGDVLQPIVEQGYHRLRIGPHELVLAVAPHRCLSVSDLVANKAGKLWGTAIQIPSLHEKPGPYGDFADLRQAVRAFAQLGADAVAISPVHAQPAGTGGNFSPYSPSSRLFLNAAFAALAVAAGSVVPTGPIVEGYRSGADHGFDANDRPPENLIDWSASLPRRQRALRQAYRDLKPQDRAAFEAWVRQRGGDLQRQATFDALSLHFQAADWRAWPIAYRHPEARAVKQYAAEHEDEVGFHLYCQWLSDRSLGEVQAEATAAGMSLGLFSDLAVGVVPGGSDAWAASDSLLTGLTIGAPSDPLGPEGQNWNLVTYSPDGLRRTAFEPWIAMLRANLRHAGGIRIDHAFGLARLWVMPDGAQASEGAYLTYPFADMLRILAIESHRARAVIIGEDLGTRPPGFVEPVADKGILGMRVLWFERTHDGFLPADHFPEHAVAMTGTHDTATIAGWWTGHDLAWNRILNRGGNPEHAENHREWERSVLWSRIGEGARQPANDDAAPVVEAAIAHLGRTPSVLAIIPLEDVLGIVEQPNIPGSIDQHPNWRRRLSHPLTQLLAEPQTAQRLAKLVAAREG